MIEFQITWGFMILADIAIWFGLFFLSAKSHIRKCQKEGIAPDLKHLTISYIIRFFAVHLFLLWLGYELKKWGGPD